MTTTFEQQALAQRILDHITAHPEQHNKRKFGQKTECGTTACIAGWAGIFSGICQFEYDPDIDRWYFIANHPQHHSIAAVGRKLLGLSYFDAECLFYCKDNGLAVEALRYLANGKDIDWQKLGYPSDDE